MTQDLYGLLRILEESKLKGENISTERQWILNSKPNESRPPARFYTV